VAYIDPNYKTKKALKKALAAGETVYAYNPGLGGNLCAGMSRDDEREVDVEGPHFPEPHTWYATVAVRSTSMGCVVVKVIS